MSIPAEIAEKSDTAADWDIRDRKILEILWEADDPVLKTKEVAEWPPGEDRVMTLTQTGIRNKLNDLHQEGVIEMKKAGSGKVWWIDVDEEERELELAEIVDAIEAMDDVEQFRLRKEAEPFMASEEESGWFLRFGKVAVFSGAVLMLASLGAGQVFQQSPEYVTQLFAVALLALLPVGLLSYGVHHALRMVRNRGEYQHRALELARGVSAGRAKN